MMTAGLMLQPESAAHLRDPKLINFLFKSVYELQGDSTRYTEPFNVQEISILLDSYYKSQMTLLDKYGDMFVELL